MNTDKKVPYPPKKINLFGRRRYSAEANATDVINYSFDDCWWSINRLWFLIAALTAVVFRNQLKLGLDKIINLLNASKDIDII